MSVTHSTFVEHMMPICKADPIRFVPKATPSSLRGDTKAQTGKYLRKDPKEAGSWENFLALFG